MSRLFAIFVMACGVSGCASSPFSQAPAAAVAPTVNQPGTAGANQECVTQEGYGRTLPCGYASF
jgi:hypothetical protein